MDSKRIRNRDFFTKPAEDLAKDLLGKIICHRISEDAIIRFRITETEAYCKGDSACHSEQYKTGNAVKTQKMIGGTIYVHYKNNGYPGSSFDIVANEEGIGEGVIVRGAINVDNPKEIYDSKPRLLGEALKMDYASLNQKDLLTSEEIWLEDDGFDTTGKTKKKKRIGLENSKKINQKDKDRLLNFYLGDNAL